MGLAREVRTPGRRPGQILVHNIHQNTDLITHVGNLSGYVPAGLARAVRTPGGGTWDVGKKEAPLPRAAPAGLARAVLTSGRKEEEIEEAANMTMEPGVRKEEVREIAVEAGPAARPVVGVGSTRALRAPATATVVVRMPMHVLSPPWP